MKINCLKGYYKFYPETNRELAYMEALLQKELVKTGECFTFAKLAEIKDYSVESSQAGNAVYAKTFSGCPEDVLEANGLAYDIAADLIVPKDAIIKTAPAAKDRYCYATNSLLQAYSALEGRKVLSFSGYYSFKKGFYSYDKVVFL